MFHFTRSGPGNVPKTFSGGATAILARFHVGDLGLIGSIYKKVAQAATLIGIFLLPIFFLPWSSGILELNKQLLLVIMAGIGLVAWFLDVVMSGKLTIRFGALDKGILGLAIATILATIFSVSKFRSFLGVNIGLSDALVSVLALTAVYFLAVNVFDDSGKKVRTALLASLGLAFLFGLLQMFGAYIFKWSFAVSRVFNTVGSLNTLGLAAAVSLPLFLKSGLYLPKVKFINLSKIGALLAVSILVILNWWVLWAVAVGGMLATIALESFMTAGNAKFRISKFMFPMVIILLAAFLFITGINIAFLKKNFPAEITPPHTLSMQIAMSALKENVFTGYGPENFSLAFDKFGAKSLANTTLSNAKFFDGASQVANAVVHGGAAFVLALALFIWSLAAVALRIRKFSAGGGHERIDEISGAMSVLVALLVAMFLYPFNITLQFLFYASVALVSLVLWEEHKKSWDIEEKPLLSLAASLGFIVGLVLALAGVYFMVASYISDIKYASALGQKDNKKAIQSVVSAINWNNKRGYYYQVASQITLNLLSDELAAKVDKSDTQRGSRIQNYIASAVDLAKRATVAEPKEAASWFNLGDIYQNLIGLVGGTDKAAEEAFLKAAELRPGDPTLYNRIGSMYLGKADLAMRLEASSSGENAKQFQSEMKNSLVKAEENFKKSIDISPNFGLAIYNLGVVYDREGKLVDAIRQLEKIAPYNIDKPNLMFELGLLYYRNGQKDNALQSLKQAVLLAPDYANAQWYLALIYEERNQIDLAVEQLDNILKNNPDNNTVLNKKSDLEKGVKKIPPQKVIDQKPL
ncbi:MAG: hypothetical protein A3C81_00050 [Candidatus Yanofskybacteria bacterium RIFCSPHIGHO2_02_FULL_46_19]|uniref:Uncharacterized protein n=1 Tax=Candidatus Yanofskybacteria bacterium RIFCSPHIGHO2_02_FULL_46_19 TaxID=1802684 RepID=A0A1F8FSW3_9BACT|nr:MAG: hypothetical protein A3C81_00050 [Candidatus Yanofskybacteria bacterium RIFCSPHIGHO2_02_FULL_46_19]